MTEWTWVYVILFVGACLQSVVGFGLGLLCAPILFLILPELVPAPMILNALLLTLLIAIRHHDAINVKQTTFSIIGGTIGVLVASSVMIFLEHHQYRVLFGVSIVIGVILSAIGFRPRITALTNMVAGTLSGFMGTVTSAGGAPMGLLYQTAEHKQLKANLSVFFLYINAFGTLSLWLTGAAGPQDFILFVKCIPAILLGWMFSWLVNSRINVDVVRPLVLFVALCSGLASIVL
ncbi:sulfite exporter TauE/SafE family protein [Neptunicella sp.]|uniref:sulfite exporter TauE/SafE family protein n=1 Tax=Neptunicella sp. TaxID=2125986 RepID=UPI003F68E4FA